MRAPQGTTKKFWYTGRDYSWVLMLARCIYIAVHKYIGTTSYGKRSSKLCLNEFLLRVVLVQRVLHETNVTNENYHECRPSTEDSVLCEAKWLLEFSCREIMKTLFHHHSSFCVWTAKPVEEPRLHLGKATLTINFRVVPDAAHSYTGNFAPYCCHNNCESHSKTMRSLIEHHQAAKVVLYRT